MISEQADAEFKSGISLLAAGEYINAARTFEELLSKEPGSVRLNHYLMVALGCKGDVTTFNSVLNAAPGGLGRDTSFILNVFVDLVSRSGGWNAVEALATSLASGSLAQTIANYYAGCAAMLRGETALSFDRFASFQNYVIENKEVFDLSEDKNLNIIFRHALLIEPPSVVQSIEMAPSASLPAYSPGLAFLREPHKPGENAPSVIICSCNGIYFERFAPAFLGSAALHCPDSIVHIHLSAFHANTLKTIEQILSAIPHLQINLSVEQNPPYSGAIYYACNRFLMADRFLDFYQHAITIFDIDGELQMSPESLFHQCAPFDVALFSTDRTEPASRYSAACIHFRFSEKSLQFVDLLKRFILLKLDLPPGISWMLDQAALYSVITYFTEERRDIGFHDLRKGLNRQLTDIFAPHEDPEAKLAMMSQKAPI